MKRTGTPPVLLMVLLGLAVSRPAVAQNPKIQPELLAAMNAMQTTVLPTGEPTPLRIMVKLKKPASMSLATMNFQTAAGMAAIRNEVDLMQTTVLGQRLDGAYKTLNRYESVFGFSAVADPAAIEALAELEAVERVEIIPLYFKQSGQSHPLAGVSQLQAMGFTGQGTTIAIIDDGIDHDHAAFGGFAAFPNTKIVGGRDFADNDDDPTIDCTGQSHGTAVAGVAAGNGGGVLGTAPDAQIVMLKVQSAMRCGQPTLDGDLVGAIDWAVTHRDDFGIRVLSMSLGAGGFSTVSACELSSQTLRDAVDSAAAAGIAVLAASGNDGLCSQISRPACIGNAISVGAVYDAPVAGRGFCVSANACQGRTGTSCDADGRRACFDNNPATDAVTCYSNSASFLDILAPSDCATTANAGGGLNNCFNGTSSATPFAAGVAASLIEADGALDNDSMRDLLADHGVAVRDAKSGLDTPRLDAQASLAALAANCPPGGLSESFESGFGAWNATGLWHVATDADCAAARTGTPQNAAYYGQDASCNYATGAATTGSLTSPAIAGIDANSTLSFAFFRQVENFSGGSFDRAEVEVLTSAGASSIWVRDSTDVSAAAWTTPAPISLAAFAGESIQLRFRFDSIDEVANESVGWLLDEVVVTGNDMCSGNP